MDKKLSLEQFGAKIRLKHPEYGKYSNVEIGQRMLQKYPQYAESVDIPEAKPKNLAEKIGFTNTKVGRFGQSAFDMFTSSTQKFGQSIGEVVGANKSIQPIAQADEQASEIEYNLRKKIKTNKALGQDTSRLEKELSDFSGRSSVMDTVSEFAPSVNKSKRQFIGEALGTILEATTGGILKGTTRGVGLATMSKTAKDADLARKAFLSKSLGGRLKQIGVETGKDLATALPFGYSFDVAQNLMEDKSGAEAFKPGFGTLLSSVIPLGVGTIRAGRQVTADLLSNVVAPNLSGVQSEAYKRMRTGEVTKYIGKETPQTVLDEARTSASAFKSTMQREFGKGREEIIAEFTGKRIGIDEKSGNTLKKIAERFGFADRLPDNFKMMSAKETMDLLEEINSISKVSDLDDPLVKSLKLNLADVKKDIVSRATTEFGGEGGKFEKLYKTYSTKKTALNNMQKIIGQVGLTPNSIKLDPIKRKTAVSRLQAVFKENAESYLDAIKALEDETGDVILDKVAASQLSSVLPKTLRTAPVGIGGVVNDVISLVTFPLSSPRIGAWLIRNIGGYGKGVAESLLNASPAIRESIYDAVVKENMAFDDAVKLYARDYIENPRMGASIQDVSKTAYKETGNLTTKILKDLEGKTTVSKQYILDATNRGELKQVERDITRQILDTMKGDTINVQEFADKVKAELLPLKKLTNSQPKYENISLPDEIKGNVKNYTENIYSSPIKTSAGQTHFGDIQGNDNYFGHTRVEDMADNQTRRVIEVQSDLYQKGNLEREKPAVGSTAIYKGKEYKVEGGNSGFYSLKNTDGASFQVKRDDVSFPDLQKNIEKLQQYNDPTAHFRMVREEVKKAAQDGKTKLQFPTGETAMKIEGLGANPHEWIIKDIKRFNEKITPDSQLEVGMEVRNRTQGNSDWIITDVLGDGKFKAVQKSFVDLQPSNWKITLETEDGIVKPNNSTEKGLVWVARNEKTRKMDFQPFAPENKQNALDFLKEKIGKEDSSLKELSDKYGETFDISGKVDTNNPIYKFYEKDVQQYLKKFGGTRVKDNKGVEWIEVPIKKEWGDMPVEAFAGFGLLGIDFNKKKEEPKKQETTTKKKELPVFKTYKDGSKVFSLDKDTQVSEIHPKIKSAISETYKSYPELPKGIIEALLMKESSAGYDDTNRNPKIGKYAWIGGLTEIAKKELVRNGYKPDFDTIGGALNSMAKFWLLKSKEGKTIKQIYDEEYSSGKLTEKQLKQFEDMFNYYSKLNG